MSTTSSLGEVNKMSTSVSRTDNWGMGLIGCTYYAPVGLEAAIFGKRCPILQSWRSEDRWKRVSHFVSILSWWCGILHQSHRKLRFLLLRRSGWSLVVGIHTKVAAAPHHRTLHRRKEEASERPPHLCLKGANRQGQRAGPETDALH